MTKLLVDTVIRGRILTMDPGRPKADAIAITGNRIAAVGAWDDIARLQGPLTRIIDAREQTVLPGLIESHMHLFLGAAELEHLQLSGIRGFAAVARALQAFAAARPGSGIIFGQQADYTILDGKPLDRHALDRMLPDRPCLLFSPDHHTAWANTMALSQAGILNGRKIGVGNEIVMGADGLATGELREHEASDPVRALSTTGNRACYGIETGRDPVPAPNAAERAEDRALLFRGLEHCARHGITSFHNMDGNPYLLELLTELDAEGRLLARARVPFHMKNFMPLAELETASDMHRRYRSAKITSGFVKVFVDGVLDSGTAVMIDGYGDNPDWRGEPLFTADHFARVAIEADRRGLQIAVHAIGDGAVHIVLDGYAAAQRANGVRDSRHRIEHIEVVHPDDIARFAELGVLASMQPPHPPGCGGLPLEPTVSKIGAARLPYAYAWNTLRAAGARLVFASDWPVSSIDPIASMRWAMTRKALAPGLDDHRQSLQQAIAGYTVDGAYAEFSEADKGQLTPGKLADLVVLSGDIETTAPEDLNSLRPVLTLCDGVVTFEG
jgi:predicted amidohydrolase YtcJ